MTESENAADIQAQQEEPPKAQAEPVAEAEAEPVAEAPPSPDATATGTVAATGTAADVQSQATVAEAEAAATTTTDAKDAPPSPQAPSQAPSQAISSSDEDVRPEPEPEPFVNNGLKKWQTAREEWCRKRKSSDPETAQDDQTSSSRPKAASAIPIDVDGVIDVLFDPRWRGGSVVAGQRAKISLQPPRFPTNVPLPQMIDVLTDLWEAEGLDV